MTDCSTKLCRSCGATKLRSEFYRATRERDGLQSKCKACDKETGAKYRAEHPVQWTAKNERWNAANVERRAATIAKWQADNRERVLSNGRRWLAENKKRHAATTARWAAANSERVKARVGRWRAENPERYAATLALWLAANHEKRSASSALYRARNRNKNSARELLRRQKQCGATPSWANRKYIELFYKCAKDEQARIGRPVHVDHIVPLQSKVVCGLHNEHNLQLMIAKENRRKSNRRWPDMP